jgi:hypothetical protein
MGMTDLRIVGMPNRSEEEPDEPEEPSSRAVATAPTIPDVSTSREYEYRVELLTIAQIADGKTLAERLTTASGEGWDLVEIVDAGEQRAVVLRRPKRRERDRRPVGFTPLNRA